MAGFSVGGGRALFRGTAGAVAFDQEISGFVSAVGSNRRAARQRNCCAFADVRDVFAWLARAPFFGAEDPADPRFWRRRIANHPLTNDPLPSIDQTLGFDIGQFFFLSDPEIAFA